MKATLVNYPWDTIAHWSPDWAEIAGKAKHYKTALRRSDGRCVSLLGVISNVNGRQLTEPAFLVRDGNAVCHMETNQLCAFVL